MIQPSAALTVLLPAGHPGTISRCDLTGRRGAWFDAQEPDRYRYLLWRQWDDGKAFCNFILLNPSTADEQADDPTVTRCIARARAWGYGGLLVTNLYALRSVDPSALSSDPAPMGPPNRSAILVAAQSSELIVCGWGVHGLLNGRGRFDREFLTERGFVLHHLGLTASGQPRHPLYLSYSVRPQRWEAA